MDLRGSLALWLPFLPRTFVMPASLQLAALYEVPQKRLWSTNVSSRTGV